MEMNNELKGFFAVAREEIEKTLASVKEILTDPDAPPQYYECGAQKPSDSGIELRLLSDTQAQVLSHAVMATLRPLILKELKVKSNDTNIA